MQVIFSAEVRIKLIEIFEYYESLSRAAFGHKIRADLINKSLKLKDFPNMGQVEENLIGLRLGHRYLVESNYKIIYRIDGENILITDIFDTRQDPDKMIVA